MIFITACSKDKKVFKKENTTSTIATTLRSGTSLDTTWLINFEDYLSDLRDNISTAATYSNDETEYGIETLINLKYSRYKADASATVDIDSFTYAPGSEDPYDFFLKCKSSILEDISGNKIVAYDLALDTIISGVSHYTGRTIFSSGQVYSPLNGDPFADNESYYFGAGELHPDEPSTWLDCYGNGYNSCGGTDANGNMITTTITEFQEKFNSFKPVEYCEDYDPTSVGKFITYYDIDTIKFRPSWTALHDYSVDEKNHGWDIIPYGYISCACLDASELNNLYGVLNIFLDNSIPQGKELVFMNFATDINLQSGEAQGNKYPIASLVTVARVKCFYALDPIKEIEYSDLFD